MSQAAGESKERRKLVGSHVRPQRGAWSPPLSSERREPVPFSSLGPAALALTSAAVAAYLIHILYAVFVSRHLFADGAWFLLKMLVENHVARWYTNFPRDFFVSRFGAFFCLEYPTLLLSRLGVTDLRALSAAFGLTLFGFKPLSLLLCYAFSPDKRALLFPLLSLFAGSINAEAYIVSETHLFVSLFWPALIILLCAESISGTALVVLGLVSAPLILCYESMAVFGLVLCAACVYRMRTRVRADERAVCWGFLGWYLLGVLFAILSVVFPRDVSNRGDLFHGPLVVWRSHWAARISLLILASSTIYLFVPASSRRVRNLFVGACAGLSSLIVAQIVFHPSLTSLNVHMQARSLAVLVPVLTVPLYLMWYFRVLEIDAGHFRALFVGTALLGIAQSSWNILASGQWSNMLTIMKGELRTRAGPIPFGESAMSQATVGGSPIRLLHADWPVLLLSIIMADGGNVRAMIVPPAKSEPFNPYAAGSLLPLQRFGIRYDSYVEALSSLRGYVLGETISFDEKGNAAAYKTGTWAAAESWGTWSDGAEFGVQLDPGEPVESDLILSVMVRPFVNEKQPELSTQVLVNGDPAGEWRFVFDRTAEPYQLRELRIGRAAFNKARPGIILFRPAKIISPAELGMDSDPRRLALGFVWLRIIPNA